MKIYAYVNAMDTQIANCTHLCYHADQN